MGMGQDLETFCRLLQGIQRGQPGPFGGFGFDGHIPSSFI
jgi:hypothetical protein